MAGAIAPSHDALGLVELNSIARGYKVLDAMVKKSPVVILEANLVEPGHYLILFAGQVAEVEEAYSEAVAVAGDACLDRLILPLVHSDVLSGLSGRVQAGHPDTVGVVEGRSVSATLLACDRALKNSDVELAGLRITPGLGGKAFFVLHGAQHDVQVGLETAEDVLSQAGQLIRVECIAAPHADFVAMVLRAAPFNLESR
jgi:microcompartment protein CcmL/EutN